MQSKCTLFSKKLWLLIIIIINNNFSAAPSSRLEAYTCCQVEDSERTTLQNEPTYERGVGQELPTLYNQFPSSEWPNSQLGELKVREVPQDGTMQYVAHFTKRLCPTCPADGGGGMNNNMPTRELRNSGVPLVPPPHTHTHTTRDNKNSSQ